MIIERSTCKTHCLERHCCCVLTPAQQVDFYEVDLAGEELPLFAFLKIPALFTGGLVRWTKNLD